MNIPRPYERHDLFPNLVYKDIGIPPFTPPQNYEALHTDAFTPRPDDIVIATYSKSGTTWLQNMVYNLVGCPNGPIEMINVSVPWLQSLGVKLEDIEKMKGPRVLKTHDYWSWMPVKLRETARFIYCSRNPKDQAVSYFHHMKTFKDVHYGDKCADMTFSEFFDQIQTKKDVVEYGLWEDHNLEWLEQSSKKNILFLTYEDLKEDTEREIKKIAEFLGLSVNEERIVHTVNEGQFEHMKNNDKLNYSWFTGGSDFIRKGEVGGWVDYLTEEQSAYFDKPIQRVIEAGGKVRCHL